MRNMILPLLSVEVRYENDLVLARQKARQVAESLGFDVHDQTRISTAVSEIARNAFNYAGGGSVSFDLREEEGGVRLEVRVEDNGPGIADLEAVLAGTFRSPGGLGMGISGARRIMDGMDIRSETGRGTRVIMWKYLPAGVRGSEELARRVFSHLEEVGPQDVYDELRRQNQELIRLLEELRKRKEELERINRELEETNRGLLAFYVELDEKAEQIRQIDDLKTRFLSEMSHEFRTPLNSIRALSRLLLERVDGDLTAEQEKQVRFINKAAGDLAELVDDLLDLAKVEAGKMTVKPQEFRVEEMFGTLRGMLRPLLVGETVSLVFEEAKSLPTLYTDEGKVSQILRNFVSNSLKNTERGEIRVRAEADVNAGTVTFAVADTGTGIPPDKLETIFEDFVQLEGESRGGVKGSGLGLPICRRLATLLGGRVYAESEVGMGSTFYLEIPIVYRGLEEPVSLKRGPVDVTRYPVLVVEDDPTALLMYDKFLRHTGFQMIPATNIHSAEQALKEVRPLAVVLDILLPGGESWDLISYIKGNPETADIPVYVVSVVEEAERGLSLGADDYLVKPLERDWLLQRLNSLAAAKAVERVLIIDDDEMSRYLFRNYLRDTRFQVSEASDGYEGLRLAREERPQAIFLDLIMPELDGFRVLEELKKNPETRDIPVIIITSKELGEEERRTLTDSAMGIISKSAVSREKAMSMVKDFLLRIKESREGGDMPGGPGKRG